MIIVIAGNCEQYLAYLREHGINPRDARYASKEEDIRGLPTGTDFRLAGKYWDNPLSDDPYLNMMLRRSMVVN